MSGQHPLLRRGQKLTDSQHYVARVVAPLRPAPLVELFGEIGRRLSGERRVGRTHTLSLVSVTGRTGRQSARRVADVIEGFRLDIRGETGCDRQGRIERRHLSAFAGIEPLGDPAHLRMIAAPVGISVKLPLEIARVHPGEPRSARAIATPVEPVTGKAGVRRSGAGAAQRDDPPILREPVERGRLASATAAEQADGNQGKEIAHGEATAGSRARFRPAVIAPLLLLAVACQPTAEQRQFMPMADAANGRAVIERVGCGSCHTITGVDWPQGKVGPRLDGLAGRALIAGKLPNRPDVLAAFIRNAPALAPGSGMPAMPVTEPEARDIAAFLYQQDAN
jgi:mono/diheme cytochrome c family protein